MEKFGLISVLLSFIGCLSACDFTVTLEQDLWMDGFHRNLTYEISFIPKTKEVATVWPYKNCVFGLKQKLPAGIYANPDELSDLRRSHRLNALTKKTNVELPADQSEPVTVYVIKKILGPLTFIWIPVHARYHKAVRHGGYAQNEIEAPQLCIRCPDQRLESCDRPLKPAKFLCPSGSKEKCTWKEAPYTLKSNSPIQWKVPVGNLNEYYPVAVMTTLAVTIGSLYLLQTINEYKFVQQY